MPWPVLTLRVLRTSLVRQVEAACARACDYAWQGITPRAE